MNRMPSGCPICGEALAVTRLWCRACDTAIEGRFAPGPFAALSAEQLDFVEVFVRCEGKFTRMEGELGLSYPTIRGRLHEIIRALGHEPGAGGKPPADLEKRRAVLARLEAGEIDAETALDLMKGDE